MILIGLIFQLPVQVVRFQSLPGKLSGTYDRPECRQERAPNLCFQVLHIALRLLPLFIISQTGQECQRVGKSIKVRCVTARRERWKPVGSLTLFTLFTPFTLFTLLDLLVVGVRMID